MEKNVAHKLKIVSLYLNANFIQVPPLDLTPKKERKVPVMDLSLDKLIYLAVSSKSTDLKIFSDCKKKKKLLFPFVGLGVHQGSMLGPTEYLKALIFMYAL